MLNKNTADLIRKTKNNLIKSMQIRAEKLLNPNNYYLSSLASGALIEKDMKLLKIKK